MDSLHTFFRLSLMKIENFSWLVQKGKVYDATTKSKNKIERISFFLTTHNTINRSFLSNRDIECIQLSMGWNDELNDLSSMNVVGFIPFFTFYKSYKRWFLTWIFFYYRFFYFLLFFTVKIYTNIKRRYLFLSCRTRKFKLKFVIISNLMLM